MANVNAAQGCWPIKHISGGLIRNSAYAIAAALASNIFRGSLVKQIAGGGKKIDVCAATDRTIGVFHGCSYVDAGGNTQFRPYWGSGQTILTGSAVEADVFDDPEIIFGVQVSGAAGMVAADIGGFAEVVIGTGSTATGTSADQLDQSTITHTTASGGVFRIYELLDWVGNAYGQYAKAAVLLNRHFLGGSTTAGFATNAI